MEATETCPCCNGKRIQVLLTGEKILCKACNHTGKIPASADNSKLLAELMKGFPAPHQPPVRTSPLAPQPSQPYTLTPLVGDFPPYVSGPTCLQNQSQSGKENA